MTPTEPQLRGAQTESQLRRTPTEREIQGTSIEPKPWKPQGEFGRRWQAWFEARGVGFVPSGAEEEAGTQMALERSGSLVKLSIGHVLTDRYTFTVPNDEVKTLELASA